MGSLFLDFRHTSEKKNRVEIESEVLIFFFCGSMQTKTSLGETSFSISNLT